MCLSVKKMSRQDAGQYLNIHMIKVLNNFDLTNSKLLIFTCHSVINCKL